MIYHDSSSCSPVLNDVPSLPKHSFHPGCILIPWAFSWWSSMFGSGGCRSWLLENTIHRSQVRQALGMGKLWNIGFPFIPFPQETDFTIEVYVEWKDDYSRGEFFIPHRYHIYIWIYMDLPCKQTIGVTPFPFPPIVMVQWRGGMWRCEDDAFNRRLRPMPHAIFDFDKPPRKPNSRFAAGCPPEDAKMHIFFKR